MANAGSIAEAPLERLGAAALADGNGDRAKFAN